MLVPSVMGFGAQFNENVFVPITTLPAGSCYSVGAGGHITGGGYGFLSRLHGLTVDHLTGVDIVTWDGHQATLRHVSAESTEEGEREFFWALCGAGCGNLGVIARYYFASPPDAPDHATIWNLAWDWTNLDPGRFARLIGEYGEQMASLPETEFTALALRHVAAKQITYTLQCVSLPGTTHSEHCRHAERRIAETKARFDKIVASSPVRRPLYGRPGSTGTAPAAHAYQHLTYLEALQTLDGTGANRFGKCKSAYMRGPFPNQQVDAIYDWLNKQPDGDPAPDMSESLVQVDSYGGVVTPSRPKRRRCFSEARSRSRFVRSAVLGRDSLPGDEGWTTRRADARGRLDPSGGSHPVSIVGIDPADRAKCAISTVRCRVGAGPATPPRPSRVRIRTAPMIPPRVRAAPLPPRFGECSCSWTSTERAREYRRPIGVLLHKCLGKERRWNRTRCSPSRLASLRTG